MYVRGAHVHFFSIGEDGSSRAVASKIILVEEHKCLIAVTAESVPEALTIDVNGESVTVTLVSSTCLRGPLSLLAALTSDRCEELAQTLSLQYLSAVYQSPAQESDGIVKIHSRKMEKELRVQNSRELAAQDAMLVSLETSMSTMLKMQQALLKKMVGSPKLEKSSRVERLLMPVATNKARSHQPQPETSNPMLQMFPNLKVGTDSSSKVEIAKTETVGPTAEDTEEEYFLLEAALLLRTAQWMAAGEMEINYLTLLQGSELLRKMQDRSKSRSSSSGNVLQSLKLLQEMQQQSKGGGNPSGEKYIEGKKIFRGGVFMLDSKSAKSKNVSVGVYSLINQHSQGQTRGVFEYTKLCRRLLEARTPSAKSEDREEGSSDVEKKIKSRKYKEKHVFAAKQAAKTRERKEKETSS